MEPDCGRDRPRHRRLDCCCRCADLRIGPRQVDGSYRPTITGVSRDRRANGRILASNDYFTIARSDDEGFVARLYAAGALLVLDAEQAGGCSGLPPPRRRIVMASEAKQSIVKLGREPINLPAALARVRYTPIATKFRSAAK